MLRKLLFLSLFGLMAGPTLALSSGQAYGEILIFGAQGQDPTGPHPADAGPARPELASGVAGESIPLQIQCWQYGVKIIDEAGLDGVRLARSDRRRRHRPAGRYLGIRRRQHPAGERHLDLPDQAHALSRTGAHTTSFLSVSSILSHRPAGLFLTV